MPDGRHVSVASDLDIVAARVEGRNLAKEMGFGIIDQARIATVISELARNVVLYAGSGQIILIRVDSRGRAGLEIICEDQGPGIEDLDLVMNSEHPTKQGEGMGLSGTRRLMDEFEIQTKIGAGTKVIVRKWLP